MQSLYVMSSVDLTQHQVEASVRPYLLISNGLNGVEIRGLKFTHANTTSVSQSGAIAMTGNRLLLDGVIVTQVDGNGIDISGDDNQVRHSIANYCGMVGLKVRGRKARVLGNETSFNNTRGFNKWWEAGGAKFVGDGGLQDSEVAYNKAFNNQGDGLWFDWHNHNNRIHDNVVAYNSGMGIQYEASEQAYIYDNYVFANRQRGIYLPNVSGAVIAHNLVIANQMEGIAFIDERHAAQNGPAELIPRGNRVIANVIAWNGKTSLVLPLNGDDNRSDANLFLDRETPTFSLGWGSRERPVVRGLEAWQKISQQDEVSTGRPLPMPTDFEQQLQMQQLDPDWRWLKRITQEMHTPALNIAAAQFTRAGSPPGPGETHSHSYSQNSSHNIASIPKP